MGRCDRLKWNRKKLGMSQQDLANRIGVSVSTISKLETDETAWATIRDITDDAVSDIFRNLGSWQCNPESILKECDNNKKDINDKKNCLESHDICNLIIKKRSSLGISQKKLGTIIGIDGTTVSKYESKESLWNNRTTYNQTQILLMDFVNGKYDDIFFDNNKKQLENITSEDKEDNSTSMMVPKYELKNDPYQNVEDTLNKVIDILQEKISHNENTDVYINMIIGICNGYLRKV